MTDSKLPSPIDVTKSEAPSKKRHHISRKRLWLFRAIVVVAPFVMLVFTEIVLRAFGVGRDLTLVQELKPPLPPFTHRLNPSIDYAYYDNMDVSGPEPRPFQMPKPKGVFRIVCLGGSTVIGFPYASELAFPRQIEFLLELQNPDIDFEVLNAGVTSMNSFVVSDLTEQCLACDPDLIVIHSGHNEFYGPGGSASTIEERSSALSETVFDLRRLRLAQVFTSNERSVDTNADLLTALPQEFEIPLQSTYVKKAESNLRRNLKHAIATAQAANVPVVLSSVASKLRGLSPMRAFWPENCNRSREEEWNELLRVAESYLESRSYAEAKALLDQASQICEQHALLQYRLAQYYEATEQFDLARQKYELARDLDGCRFRAPTRFHTVFKELVENESPNVAFVDVAENLKQIASPAGPGDRFFLEHVHYTFEGHFELAKMFSQTIQQKILMSTWNLDVVPEIEGMKAIVGYLPEDDLGAWSITLQVYETEPFRECADLEAHQQQCVTKISGILQNLPEFRREAFADLTMAQILGELLEGLKSVHQHRRSSEFLEQLNELQQTRFSFH
ncbi:MAG: hypothetical protein HUJ26_08675 [Planctomycetaceae bacterium]|nr:hypothetical protein [Planctomycetaceae bacterium]